MTLKKTQNGILDLKFKKPYKFTRHFVNKTVNFKT